MYIYYILKRQTLTYIHISSNNKKLKTAEQIIKPSRHNKQILSYMIYISLYDLFDLTLTLHLLILVFVI